MPFEDVLGVASSDGYSSIVVPGSGEANFDTFEANPFEVRRMLYGVLCVPNYPNITLNTLIVLITRRTSVIPISPMTL